MKFAFAPKNNPEIAIAVYVENAGFGGTYAAPISSLMIEKYIRREISELLITGIKDERVSQGMVSVTHVDVAGDLQHCKIFVSIFGSDDDRIQAMAGLQSAAGYVKGELGRRLKMRRTPEVVFQLDRGLESFRHEGTPGALDSFHVAA